MRSRDGIRVSMTTSGRVSPGYATLGGGYRWRKIPGWKPGDVRFRQADPPGPGGEANASRRHARLERFAVILAELTAGRPEHASDAHVRKAGELAGVGEKTAREYEQIAAQSPGHAALVAAFQAIPPAGSASRRLRDIEAWKRAHRTGIKEAQTWRR